MALAHARSDDEGAAVGPESGVGVIFPAGLVGCPDWRHFRLTRDPDVPSVWLLESLDDAAIGFLLLEASAAEPGFFDGLDPADRNALEALGAGREPHVVVYCTLTIQDTGSVTANLAGPLVIDHRRRRGAQPVLVNSPWTTRHPIASVEA